MKEAKMASEDRRLHLSKNISVTAGTTMDGKFSLAVNWIEGAESPCLCLHKCDERGGLHYSTLDNSSIVTAISKRTLKNALQYIGEMEARDGE